MAAPLGLEPSGSDRDPRVRPAQVRVGVEVSPALSAAVAVDGVAVRGDTADVMAELAEIFADAKKLRSWWPGSVDDLSCLEGREILALLREDVLGEDPARFRKLRLAVDVAATLRRDDAAEDVIFAAAARRGVRVDASVYLRDLVLDSLVLGRDIHHRRLHAAAAADPPPPPPRTP